MLRHVLLRNLTAAEMACALGAPSTVTEPSSTPTRLCLSGLLLRTAVEIPHSVFRVVFLIDVQTLFIHYGQNLGALYIAGVFSQGTTCLLFRTVSRSFHVNASTFPVASELCSDTPPLLQ